MLTLNTRTASSDNFLTLFRRGFALLAMLALLPAASAAQNDKDMPVLEPGKPIERELAGDAAHSCRITLAANQFLHVVVEQKGIDVVVALFAPDGKKVAEIDSPNGTQGPEPISVVAEAAGNYRLEVRSLEAKAKAGRYQVKVAELRAAQPQDKSRIAAQQAFTEALQLVGEGSAGSRRQAIAKFQAALPLWRAANDRAGEAETLNQIGQVHNLLGERQQALDYYNQSLPLMRAVGTRDGEVSALANIAKVERDRGNLTEARARIEEALTIIESLRTKIASQELRSSYFATVQKYYEFYIDLLMRLHRQKPSAGYDGRALQASERGRSRSLLEVLTEANADIRQGVDSKLLERERALQQQLNAKAQQQTRLLSGRHTKEQADALAKEIDALTTEFQQTAAQIRQTSPRYAALTQPLSAQEIQTQVLDADTLLLEYALGDEKSYLWAVTPTSITSYELPKRAEIEDAARQFYALLTARQQGTTSGATGKRELGTALRQQAGEKSAEVASSLSRMLLGPVAGQLGKKRLLIVADGALQYIPFGALPAPSAQVSGVGGRGSVKTSAAGDAVKDAGDKFLSRHPTPDTRHLILDHEIVNLPSASTLAVLRREAQERQPAPKAVAVLADPVFESTDERIKKRDAQTARDGNGASPNADEGRGLSLVLAKTAKESGVAGDTLRIPRLPGTRREAEQIVKLVPAAQRRQAFDFAASRQTATDPELSQYRYVHFATHGFLNSQHPELSGLMFTMFDEEGRAQDGFLRAHEVFNLKLSADVVVLSACQTGLGKEVRGEGLVGLTRGFMYAGSPHIRRQSRKNQSLLQEVY